MALERLLLETGQGNREPLERLVDVAVDLAKPTDATVYLLYVFPESEYDEFRNEASTNRTLSTDELAARHGSMRVPSDRLQAAGVDYRIRGVVGGRPAEQVVRKLDELDIDMVLVGGSERTPAGKAVFGDRAQRVLLNAPCPATYVRWE